MRFRTTVELGGSLIAHAVRRIDQQVVRRAASAQVCP